MSILWQEESGLTKDTLKNNLSDKRKKLNSDRMNTLKKTVKNLYKKKKLTLSGGISTILYIMVNDIKSFIII